MTYLGNTIKDKPYWPNGAYEKEACADSWIEQATGDSEDVIRYESRARSVRMLAGRIATLKQVMRGPWKHCESK